MVNRVEGNPLREPTRHQNGATLMIVGPHEGSGDNPDDRGAVQTVLGPVSPATLGTTLVHEHLWSDMTPMLGAHGEAKGQPFDGCAVAGLARWNPAISADNYRLTDLDVQVAEISEAVASGVCTFVDATPPALGRDPHRLVEISEATGAHVVMGAGWYLERTHPADFDRRDIESLTRELTEEVIGGVGTTGIRPGIIGEIGTGDPMTAGEKRALRAAARTARDTGLALSVHVQPWGHHGHEVVEAAAGEGLATHRVLLNHMSTAVGDDTYLRSLLATGANLAFDLFGFDHSLLSPGRFPPSDHAAALQILDLVEVGAVAQLFVSQDVGVRTRLRRHGGWGYGHIVDRVLPLMLDLGLEESAASTMLTDNPRRLLAIDGSPSTITP